MAILIATVKVKDPEKFQQYAASVPATMEPFGGKLLGRGKVEKGIDGDVSFHAAAMFEFPDAESIDNWHHSAEYQKIVPLRLEAADMELAILESI